jgi:hypothetical protein
MHISSPAYSRCFKPPDVGLGLINCFFPTSRLRLTVHNKYRLVKAVPIRHFNTEFGGTRTRCSEECRFRKSKNRSDPRLKRCTATYSYSVMGNKKHKFMQAALKVWQGNCYTILDIHLWSRLVTLSSDSR